MVTLFFFNRLQADPSKLGLAASLNLTTLCLAAQTPDPDADCTWYLSFDGISVTSEVRHVIASVTALFVILDNALEPVIWAMMIAAMGLVRVAMWRRGKTMVLAS